MSKKLKTWNVMFHRDPLHEETQIKAPSGLTAAKMLMDVLPDVTVERVWEIQEDK
jgi:hypothetical protein